MCLTQRSLPPGTGVCSSCSWGCCTSAQAMPRRARSTGRWPPSPEEDSSRSIGLLENPGADWFSRSAVFPGWMELFTISRSQAGLADKRGRLVSNQCVQTASHPGWHEKRQTALILAAPPTAHLPTKWCALTPWPLLIIAGLLEPLGSPWRPC